MRRKCTAVKMPLGYRINKFLSSRFGEFRTGDRVAVTGSRWGDYTGTVVHSVYQTVTVAPDPGTTERLYPDVYGVTRSLEAKSQCVRIWNG
ncbi:hypothetical protein ACFV3R_09970 [Streptomyces sp. NPDC059740]|uniref:hypothetical protein n=1 Tax=Streptomyces sp. NPDC059740 TaxID=3346926 RepID=UPI00365F762A